MMLDQAAPPASDDESATTKEPVELGDLDLRTVVAETVNLDGDLVLVVTDEDSRVYFNPGAGGDAMSAIRGALKVAAAASEHARRLSARLGRSLEYGTAADDAVGSHLPVKPSWVCTWCEQPWPCPTKRRRLAAEYEDSPTALYVLMTVRFAEATADLSVAELPTLHRRFLDWIPSQQAR